MTRSALMQIDTKSPDIPLIWELQNKLTAGVMIATIFRKHVMLMVDGISFVAL